MDNLPDFPSGAIRKITAVGKSIPSHYIPFNRETKSDSFNRVQPTLEHQRSKLLTSK